MPVCAVPDPAQGKRWMKWQEKEEAPALYSNSRRWGKYESISLSCGIVSMRMPGMPTMNPTGGKSGGIR